MKATKSILAIAVSTIVLTGCISQGIIDKENLKAVDHAVWHKHADVDPINIINKAAPEGDTSLIFIRRMDDDPEQTGANISINDRYQVSLHPNNYTQVNSCAGINNISAEVTGLKTNDLLLNAHQFVLAPNSKNFFYVDVDGKTGESKITQIKQPTAEDILEGKTYQSHQVTRVVPNCPAAEPEPVKQPVLEKEVRIELEVLFDTDKSIIKPAFFHEVAEVAEFMKVYTNTTALIEGHTDSRASDSYNQKLSQRRANAVKDMLINRYGIESNRLQAIGFGESRPRATNSTKEGMQLNRRTIAVINERVRIDENGNQILD